MRWWWVLLLAAACSGKESSTPDVTSADTGGGSGPISQGGSGGGGADTGGTAAVGGGTSGGGTGSGGAMSSGGAQPTGGTSTGGGDTGGAMGTGGEPTGGTFGSGGAGAGGTGGAVDPYPDPCSEPFDQTIHVNPGEIYVDQNPGDLTTTRIVVEVGQCLTLVDKFNDKGEVNLWHKCQWEDLLESPLATTHAEDWFASDAETIVIYVRGGFSFLRVIDKEGTDCHPSQ